MGDNDEVRGPLLHSVTSAVLWPHQQGHMGFMTARIEEHGDALSYSMLQLSSDSHSAYNLLATTVQGRLSDLPMCPEEENTAERVNTQHCLPQLVYGETRILRKTFKYQKSIVFPLQYLVFPRLRESVSQKSESHMAQFVEYDTSRKRTGKMALVNILALQT